MPNAALEAQVFSLRFHDAFWSLYGPTASVHKEAIREWDADIDHMAQSVRLRCIVSISSFTLVQLVNICATLSEFPEIRYYDPKPTSRATIVGPSGKEHFTVTLAKKVYDGLKQYCRDNEGFPVRLTPSRKRKGP